MSAGGPACRCAWRVAALVQHNASTRTAGECRPVRVLSPAPLPDNRFERVYAREPTSASRWCRR